MTVTSRRAKSPATRRWRCATTTIPSPRALGFYTSHFLLSHLPTSLHFTSISLSFLSRHLSPSWLRCPQRRRPSTRTPSVSIYSSGMHRRPTDHRLLGVLGALSDIQKEQRKHAVHMATLRAHGMSSSTQLELLVVRVCSLNA